MLRVSTRGNCEEHALVVPLIFLYFAQGTETSSQIFYNLPNVFMQYKYANYLSPNYPPQREGTLSFQLIKQRSDFAFKFYSRDVTNVSAFAIPLQDFLQLSNL